ncbi:MAG TPA: DNA replication/repair protein RecF [Anaerolineales bacterium]|nr:DNA replication/repair protein RecF [Anaerolineales bacterium]
MHLTHLSLTNFRNFARLDVEVPRQPVMLVGGNAQGKTSLLESVYYLATLTSFNAEHDRQLINFLVANENPAVGRIVAVYERGGKSHRLEVRIILESNGFNGSPRLRKEALLDGVKLKLSEAVGKFNAVLFLPQMLTVIEGAPEERRRYLNLALGQVLPRYPESLSNYNQALAQRNALLKLLGEEGGDTEQLAFWDEQIATNGAHLVYARIRALQELETLAARIHHELTRGGEVLRLSYQPAYDPLPPPPGQLTLLLKSPVYRSNLTLEQIKQGFRESLLALRKEEIYRGVTTIGPHRDEFRFLESGIDLGTYGSRGQVRTAMMALKLAEVIWMEQKTGESPVLLLDEVLAELDALRRADLLTRLEVGGQTLLTTTDLDLFSAEFVRKAAVWRIQAGRLEMETGDAIRRH